MFIPKNVNIKKEEIQPDLKTTKEILNISLPTVSSRLIGNIGFFLEPIILTNILLYVGYSNHYILTEYGIYNAYSISLLAMPSFFIQAISSSLLPEISKFYINKNIKMIKKRLKQALIISFVIGTFFSISILIFREQLLEILYKTNNGSGYIKILAPFFILFYLEGPLQSVLQALNKFKSCMYITLIAIFIKLITMAILSLCHIGMYSLVIAEIINIIIMIILYVKYIKKELYK